LVVKKNGRIINEFSFDSGPVYIGRYKYNQVILPDLAVSRQHAAIFTTLEGKWVVEDMGSANKTYLNGEEIKKAEIKTGDCLRIADYIIEIELGAAPAAAKQIHLEDTLVPASQRASAAAPTSARDIIIRKPNVVHAPDIRLPAKRIKDFLEATETICRTSGLNEVQTALLEIMFKHFKAFQVWCALRGQPEGPMVFQMGKKRDGSTLLLNEIHVNKQITEVLSSKEFILYPRISASVAQAKIRSAMIAPVVDPAGCFGILYVANTIDSEHYSLSDLDYLMLLAIHTAAIVENF
jgi:two-component system NtrC family sensor kinase